MRKNEPPCGCGEHPLAFGRLENFTYPADIDIGQVRDRIDVDVGIENGCPLQHFGAVDAEPGHAFADEFGEGFTAVALLLGARQLDSE